MISISKMPLVMIAILLAISCKYVDDNSRFIRESSLFVAEELIVMVDDSADLK